MKVLTRAITSFVFAGKIFLFYSPVNATPGPVAYWSFNETSGTTLIDSSGNGNTAYINTATRVAGVNGNALSFNGSNDYAYANNSASLNIINQITIECWVNTRTLSGHQTIFRKTDAYGLGIGSGGNIGFFIFDSPGSWHGSWNLSSQALQTLQWYHIAGVWDGVTMKVYINGVQDPTTYAYNGPAASNTNAVYIGENSSGPQEFFNGSVDELKVYNIALSSDTILAHYNSVPHSIPVLIAYTPNPTYNWRPLLQWHVNPAISQFRIQIATDTAFSSPTVSLTTTDTFYLPTADVPLGHLLAGRERGESRS
ncbi:MAG: LamG domain-containing protein [Chitinispirillaceae bacterium]